MISGDDYPKGISDCQKKDSGFWGKAGKQKGRPSGLPFLTKLTNLTKPKLMKKNVLQRYVPEQ